MATTKALVVTQEGVSAAIQDVPIPQLGELRVLVKVVAIALNPSDWKSIDYRVADLGARVGYDYSGIVHEVGTKVTNFQKGDRIAGLVHGGDRTNHDNGSFAEVISANVAVATHIPEAMTYEEAATLGVSMMTVGLSLYKTLRLPSPLEPVRELSNREVPILIHAASTSTALFGIQFAKASGLTVIATTSPHNFDHVRMAGADVVYDYKSPTCASDIKEYTQNRLVHAWDCMGTGTKLCAAAMSDSDTGVYVTINPVDERILHETNPKVDGPHFVIAQDGIGDEYIWEGKRRVPGPENLSFATEFFKLCYVLLSEGKVKPVKFVVNKTGSGLEGALKGLDELRHGHVSGAKLVYTV
ncbi:putative alcohol dehydrogenase [Xylaria intraflava]|nr:putative alcohol dehydrogenase [Xylaria intraflava]